MQMKNTQRGDSKSAFLDKVVSFVSRRFRKSENGRKQETINPLWNIDARYVEMVHDLARTGNMTLLQYLYNEVEQNDPTLLVCNSRRSAALSELDWKVVESDQRRFRTFGDGAVKAAAPADADKVLVQEQIACLESAVAGIDNLPETLEHLALAAFRGYSHVNPVREIDGTVKHFDLLDSWNVCFDPMRQVWLWNPDAAPWCVLHGVTPSNNPQLEAIPSSELVTVVKKRCIDWPAMKIYLRMALGERDWGRFLESYGLPPVIITMPELTSDDQVDKYMKAAEAVFEGRSGVVPNGSEINYASESRGTNPFTEFIEHQQKLIVLMATGGTLTSLAESGSGTLAGGAQMDVWREIVRADARVTANAINKQFCEVVLKRAFKGKPIMAEFQMETEPKPNAKDVLELAGLASSAGFTMDAEELSQRTGYTIRVKPEGDGGFGGGGGFNGGGAPATEARHDPEPGDVVESASAETAGIDGSAGTDAPDEKAVSEALESANAETSEKRPVDAPVENAEDGACGNAERATARNLAENGETSATADEPLPADADNGAENGPSDAEKSADAELNPVPTPGAPEDGDAGKTVAGKTASRKSAGDALVEALQDDFSEVAKRLAEVLALPEDERPAAAAKLVNEIDRLVPDDPAMREVIAGQMKAAFDAQIKKEPLGDEPAANKAVPNARV